MKLWLDDIREAPDGWRRVYTADSLIRILLFNPGDIQAISLDNDLGQNAPEGYKVLDWIEERIVLGDYSPPVVYIHSANPVARQRMESTLRQIQMRLDDKGDKNVIGDEITAKEHQWPCGSYHS